MSPVGSGKLAVSTSTPYLFPHAVVYLLSSVFQFIVLT